MKNKKNITILSTIIYVLIIVIVGCAFFHIVNNKTYRAMVSKYEKLKNDYEILELQYKRDLEDCYTQFGDYQDKVEAGCYVNGGWNCE